MGRTMRKRHDVTLLRARVSGRACGAKAPSSSELRRTRTAPPSTAHWATSQHSCTHSLQLQGLKLDLLWPKLTPIGRARRLTGTDRVMQNALGVWRGVARLPPPRPVSTCYTGIFDYCHDRLILTTDLIIVIHSDYYINREQTFKRIYSIKK